MKHTSSAPAPDIAPTPDWQAFETFARQALEHMAAGDHPDAAALRAQLNAAGFVELDYTGAGFFLTLSVPESCPKLSRSGEIGDVQADRHDGANPIGAILFVRNGLAECLEVFGYANWPANLSGHKFGYIRWRPTGDGGAVAEPTESRDEASFWGPEPRE